MFGVKDVRLGTFMVSGFQYHNLQTIGPILEALEEGSDSHKIRHPRCAQ